MPPTDPNATPAAPCCTADEIMAKIKPEVLGSSNVGDFSVIKAPDQPSTAGQVGGPVADWLLMALQQLGPVIIAAILAHFHISAKTPDSADGSTTEEVMAKIGPGVFGVSGAGAVGGPIGDALVMVVEQLAPILINAILAHFHISKKPAV